MDIAAHLLPRPARGGREPPHTQEFAGDVRRCWRQLSLIPHGEGEPDPSAGGRGRRRWSPREDLSLKRLHLFEPAGTIARRLGRSAKAVRRRIERLGLGQDRGAGHGLSTALLAARLGVSPDRVRRWLRLGLLDGARTAVGWRVFPEDVETFLRRHRDAYDPSAIRDRGWAAFVAALPRMSIPRLWLTVPDASRLLPYGERGVRKLIARGDLAADLVRGEWLIPRAAIDTFVPPPLGHRARVPAELARRREDELARRAAAGFSTRTIASSAQRDVRTDRRRGSVRARSTSCGGRVVPSRGRVLARDRRIPPANRKHDRAALPLFTIAVEHPAAADDRPSRP